MKENRAVIITGMHRSGTSLVSSLLQKIGVDIGYNLLGPSKGNPRGHFEDVDFYQFHDNILHRFKQPLLVQRRDALGKITPAETKEALALIELRNNCQIWGWKDPRTTLFLDFWHQLLPQACYVFIYRHPLEVTLSLLRRGTDLEVLADPMNGLRAWLLHNQAILDFYLQHQEICLLAHISGIVVNIEAFVNLVVEKFELSLQQSDNPQTLYHSDELRQLETANTPEVISILEQITPDVTGLYGQLEAYADLSSSTINQGTTRQRPPLEKLSVLLSDLGSMDGETKTVASSIFSLLLAILDPQLALARETQIQTLITEQKHHIDALEEIIASKLPMLESTLDAIYQTRAWRMVLGYWRLKENLLAISHKIHKGSDQNRSPNKSKLPSRSGERVVEQEKIAPHFTTSKKKLAFVLPNSMDVGGVTSWSIEMCGRLAAMGQATALIEHSGYGSRMNIDIPQNVQLLSCAELIPPTSSNLTKQEITKYLPYYRGVLPGVVIPNWSIGTYATCALLATKKPESIRVIGVAHTDAADYYEWLTHYEPIIHRFIAVSHEIAANLISLMPHRERDVIIRPYAVQVSHPLTRTYALPQEPLQLVYAGRLTEQQKRISDLIRLVQILTREQVYFQLRIIGDGADKEMMYRKIRLLSPAVRQHVKREGTILPEHMPDIWHSADICVLVSEYEGTSISMLEAMSYGCVPVVTRVSGTAALIQHGKNGFLAPVGETAGMAQIIKELDANRQSLAKLGQNAHTTVAEHHSFDKYIPWFLDLIEEVWRQPARAWPGERTLLPPKQALE